MFGALIPHTIACSGPGAMRVIQENILYAREQALLVGALAVLSGGFWLLCRRIKALPILVTSLLLVHPAWTVSAVKGDCGFSKASIATSYTILALISVASQMVIWIWPVLRKVSNCQQLQAGGNVED
jgi:hypothetical protein